MPRSQRPAPSPSFFASRVTPTGQNDSGMPRDCPLPLRQFETFSHSTPVRQTQQCPDPRPA